MGEITLQDMHFKRAQFWPLYTKWHDAYNNFSSSCTINENTMYFYLKDHEKNNLQLNSELCQPKE